jgi:hypothetical protein
MSGPQLIDYALWSTYVAASIYLAAEAFVGFYNLNTMVKYKVGTISPEECIRKLSKIRFPFFARLRAREDISSIQKYTIK